MAFPFQPGQPQLRINDDELDFSSEFNGNAIFGGWDGFSGVPQQQQQPQHSLPYQQQTEQYQQPQHFSAYLAASPQAGILRPPAMVRGDSYVSTMSDFSNSEQYHVGGQNAYVLGDTMGQPQLEMPCSQPPIDTSIDISISPENLRVQLQRIIEQIYSLHDTVLRSSTSDQILLQLMEDGVSRLQKLTQDTPSLERHSSKTQKFRCVMCLNGKTYRSRGTLKRHAQALHFHDIEYCCGICPPPRNEESWQWRRDKFTAHMARVHKVHLTPSGNEYTRQWPAPTQCPMPVCSATIDSWEDFWKHFSEHCVIHEQEENLTHGNGSERGDNGDRSNGNGGHLFRPAPNNGDLGNAPGNFQPNHHGSNGAGNGGTTYGASSEWGYSCNATGGSSILGDLGGSQSSPNLRSPAPASTAVPNPLPIRIRQDSRDLRNRSGLGTVHETTWPTEGSEERDNILPEAVLRKHGQDSLPKDSADKETTCNACNHTITGCPSCAQLVATPAKCHQCTDKSCKKTPMGSIAVGARLSVAPRDEFPWNKPENKRGKSSNLFSIMDFEKGPKVVSNPAVCSTGDGIGNTEVNEMVFSLQIHDSTSKRSAGDGLTSLQKSESETEAESPPGLYFERYLYTRQSQGSFLQCVHETLVVLEPHRFIVSSFQEIVYREASRVSDKQLEIPGEQLFYLAREKDHESSEANLLMARQSSPKRRAHLRVRIRVIAGVLALRAAVSKSPPMDGNIEHGDGWELGIPLRAVLPSREKMMMGVTYVVYFLAFCLGLTDPHIYLSRWVDGDWDGLLLT
ncbi:hypothetical protein BJX64DRAFT_215294 [Aspergillus heterothallicus]